MDFALTIPVFSKCLFCLFEMNSEHCTTLSATGILDQGAGVLIVFEETVVDKTYENALETIHSMGKVVDALYAKAKKLT